MASKKYDSLPDWLSADTEEEPYYKKAMRDDLSKQQEKKETPSPDYSANDRDYKTENTSSSRIFGTIGKIGSGIGRGITGAYNTVRNAISSRIPTSNVPVYNPARENEGSYNIQREGYEPPVYGPFLTPDSPVQQQKPQSSTITPPSKTNRLLANFKNVIDGATAGENLPQLPGWENKVRNAMLNAGDFLTPNDPGKFYKNAAVNYPVLGALDVAQSAVDIPRVIGHVVDQIVPKSLNKYKNKIVLDALDTLDKSIQDKKNYWEEQSKSNDPITNFVGQTVRAALPVLVTGKIGGMIGKGANLAGISDAAYMGSKVGQMGEVALPYVERAAQMAPFAGYTFGTGAKQAEQEGAAPIQQLAYGTVTSAIETLSEEPILSDWITKIGSKEVIQEGAKYATKTFGKKVVPYILDSVKEGFQEAMVDPPEAAAAKLIYNKDMPWYGPGGVIDFSQMGQDAAGGVALGVLMTALGLPREYQSRKRAERLIASQQAITQDVINEIKDQVDSDVKDFYGYDSMDKVNSMIQSFRQAAGAPENSTSNVPNMDFSNYRTQPQQNTFREGPEIVPESAFENMLNRQRVENKLPPGPSVNNIPQQEIKNTPVGNNNPVIPQETTPGNKGQAIKEPSANDIKVGNKVMTDKFGEVEIVSQDGMLYRVKNSMGNTLPIGRAGLLDEMKKAYAKQNTEQPNQEVKQPVNTSEIDFGITDEEQSNVTGEPVNPENQQVKPENKPVNQEPQKIKLYHGSNVDNIETLNPGTWFSSVKGFSDKFAEERAQKKKGKARTYEIEVDLSKKKIADISEVGIDDYVTLPQLAKMLGVTDEELRAAYDKDPVGKVFKSDKPTALRYITEMKSFNDLLKSKGYDVLKSKEGYKSREDYVPTYKFLDETKLGNNKQETVNNGKIEEKESDVNADTTKETGKQADGPSTATKDNGQGAGTDSNGQGDKETPKGNKSETIQPTSKGEETNADAGKVAEDGRRGKGQAGGTTGEAGAGQNNGNVPGPGEQTLPEESPGKGNSNEPTDTTIAAGTNYRIDLKNLVKRKTFNQQAKYKDNVAAIKLLKKIEAEGRMATKEEQEILAKYVGWGGIPQVFNTYTGSDKWKAETDELLSILTPEEYESENESVKNAHYTAPEVIQAMYNVLDRLGFKGGRIMEPAMGIGNFFGLFPAKWEKKSSINGIEIDPIPGRIAKQLYQNANIGVHGFQDNTFPDNYFDLFIGNVPFGEYSVHDKRYDKKKLLIHDYFFVKSLDQVAPGGVVAFITSKGTLDKKDSKARKLLAEKADLITAIRLPNTAFRGNANTSVTTDIIILRKRAEGEKEQGDSFINIGRTQDGVPVNEYFIKHPENLLGQMVFDNSMYGNESETALKSDGRDIEKALDDVIGNLPKNVLKPVERTQEEPIILPPNTNIKDNGFGVVNGELYRRIDKLLEPVLRNKAKIISALKVRDAVHKVFDVQLQEKADGVIKSAQAELNKLYDAFVNHHGRFSDKTNKQVFRDDPDFFLLQALEKNVGGVIEKADIFTKRTLEKVKRVEKVETAQEALTVSLNETGGIDFDRMKELTGKKEKQLIDELKGLIFKNPNGTWETADEYLSGNVRQKLRDAESMANTAPGYKDNVEALKAVQPTNIPAKDIKVRFGAAWIPEDTMKDFIAHILEIPSRHIDVTLSRSQAVWGIQIEKGKVLDSINRQRWGTQRKKATDIIEAAINLKQPVVNDYIDGKPIKNKKETKLAWEKQKQIENEFNKWIFSDQERRERLVNLYNEEFNNLRLRTYDGSHLNFPGMNALIKLREHQANAVARIIYGGNTLLAHCVGAGKTFTMQAAGMELKRIGLVKKPMYVVPNSIAEQFAKEFKQLYPNANILAATKKDFEADNRNRLMSRIATGDWDAVIIPHSSFSLLPVSRQTQEEFLREQIAELEEAILSTGRADDNRIVKQLQNAKAKLKEKLDTLLDSERDDTVTFEQLGVDQLFVDEAHNFKNLMLHTKMSRIAGVQTSSAKKTEDMYMKVRYISKLKPGRGIVFATGTPVSNSMVELYTMQKYLQLDMLKQTNLAAFDAWAVNFGNVVSSMEVSPTGVGYRSKQRFSQFYNLPELMTMFRNVADIQTPDMLKLPTPELDGGTYNVVDTEPSAWTKAFIDRLVDRADAISKGEVDKTEDNMLNVTNDGRRVALDQRLIDSHLPDDPNSKINMGVDNIYKEWKDGQKDRLTQLVFCDLGTPKGKSLESMTEEERNKLSQDELLNYSINFNVYDDIKKKLIKMGVPAEEIAFIHDANTDNRRLELFTKVKAGQVRILIGSTAKMGEGVNVQDRLVAIHELDVPWRPSDVTQREGRILRQGNLNKKVRIYRYATQGTFDAYSWQTIETKAKFIEQIMKGDSTKRDMEDIDQNILGAAEMKAIASDNPLIKEKLEVDAKVQDLQSLEGSYNENKYDIQDAIARAKREIKKDQEYIKKAEHDAKTYADNKPKEFEIIIGGKTYTDKKEAYDALIEISKGMSLETRKAIGKYAGFNLSMYVDKGYDKKRDITLESNGKTVWQSDVSDSDVGTFERLKNVLEGIEGWINYYKREIEQNQKEIPNYEKQLEEPFEHAQELADLLVRKAQIDAELDLDNREGNTGDEDADEDEEIPVRPNNDIDTTGVIGILPPGFGSFRPRRNRNRMVYQFADAAAEENWSKSHGVKSENMVQRVKDFFNGIKEDFTRTFKTLPETGEFAQLKFDLVRYPKIKGIATQQVIRYLDDVLATLSRDEYKVFERKVFLDDLQEDADINQDNPDYKFPNGFDRAMIANELQRIQPFITPEIQEAINKRKQYWTDIKEAYVEAMQKIGFDVSDRFKRENYFRHQVLEYANYTGVFGTGKKLKTPTGRGFLKQRHGYEGNINTDYLQVELEVMGQMRADTEIARMIGRIDKNYSITQRLKDEAKMLRGSDPAYENTTWEDLIPEGYTTWQPREGRVFYTAYTIPEKMADELLSQVANQVNVEVDDLRKVIAMGQKRRQFVVKQEIAETLDSLFTPKNPTAIESFLEGTLNMWKMWVTGINPKQMVKFNIRNYTGDLDAVLGMAPGVMKYHGRAINEINQALKGFMTKSFEEFANFGGFETAQLPAEGIRGAAKMGKFAKLTGYKERNPLKHYREFAINLSNNREAILRYAAYLYYKNSIAKANGRIKNYGTSKPEMVNNLGSIEEKAFQLSKDLLGSYDEVSAAGQYIAKHLIPFYRWTEVNFKRYTRAMKNAMTNDGTVDSIGKLLIGRYGIKVPAAIVRKIGLLFLKAFMFSAIVALWNQLVFGDYEDELSDQVKDKPHIIFGKDSDGNILYFSRLGALSDFMEWFGLDRGIGDIKDILNGNRTVQEQIVQMIQSPASKMISSVNPMFKTPAEALTKIKLYPNITKPQVIKDRGQYIAQSVGLDQEYKVLAGLPRKPYLSTVADIALYRSDPEESAYYKAVDLKNKYTAKQGGLPMASYTTSPRSMALYNLKTAMRYGDQAAIKKYSTEYIKQGGTEKGYEQSLKYLDPLYGLNVEEKDRFMRSLTLQERQAVDRANKFYKEVLDNKIPYSQIQKPF
jgi:N12 class adenine-specific DNA methylase/small basic protein